MNKLFFTTALNLIITICSFSALRAENFAQNNIQRHAGDKALYITQIELPETLLQNINSLNEEIKHTWPDAKFYRETIDFGKVFPALEEGYIIERPIPDFIAQIRGQLFEMFKDQINEDVTAADYDNCIITIYQAGNGIAPHIDRNYDWASKAENRKYYFGESILGLIVEPDTAESLYFENPKAGEDSRFYLNEKAGTAFMFQGIMRNQWKHGLAPIAQKRISMTFRRVMVKE